MMYGSLSHDYSGRKRKKKKATGEVYKKYKPKFEAYVPRPTYRRDSAIDNAPSNVSQSYNTFKKESQKYTGTLIKGIATMHKSNAVPIIDQKEAEDIARMRRG